MKVLIISDSHGLTTELIDIKRRHQVEYMIHCGDSELASDAEEMVGFIAVRGNCDTDSRYPNEKVVNIGDFTFFITHGHLHSVKNNLVRLSYYAEELAAEIVCFGHTHIAGSALIENQLFINPGSIHLPKKRQEKTYAILKLENSKQKKSVHIQFYTVDGKELPGLSNDVTL